jgi:hypothetical protein
MAFRTLGSVKGPSAGSWVLNQIWRWLVDGGDRTVKFSSLRSPAPATVPSSAKLLDPSMTDRHEYDIVSK